jgi:hypothetical protein
MWQYAYTPWKTLPSAKRRSLIHERAEKEGVSVMHFRDGTVEVRSHSPEKVRSFLTILEREFQARHSGEAA